MTPPRSFGRVIVDRVRCPDCGLPADAMFGNHQGECRVPAVPWPKDDEPLTAAQVIKRYAETHEWLSANDLRPLMHAQGITSYASALTAAVNRGWLRKGATVASDDEATKSHAIRAYESRLYPSERKTA